MILCELGQIRKEATAADDSCAEVWLIRLPPNPRYNDLRISLALYYMFATNIPYLHCRNGIYYYRNQSVWKSLRTRFKQEALIAISGATLVINDTSS